MSAQTYELDFCLYTRSMFARAGVKKTAKQLLSRSRRLAAKQELQQEVVTLASPGNFFEVQSAEQPKPIRAFSTDSLDAEESLFRFDARIDNEDDISYELPMDLEGSLPDYMLDALEASQGDVFAHLVMFETVTPDRNAHKAFACRMDDAEDFYA